MSLLRKILLTFFLLFPISNSFSAVVTEVRDTDVADGGSNTVNGIEFNKEGTKMFTVYQGHTDAGDPNRDEGHGAYGTEPYRYVNEYTLSTPFDISTKTYAGNSERCQLDYGVNTNLDSRHFDLKFSNDGMKLFTTSSSLADSAADSDRIYRFDLTSPFDVSTCSYVQRIDLDTDALQNESNAGTRGTSNTDKQQNRIQGMEISRNGMKLFAIYHGQASFSEDNPRKTRLLEYQLTSSYDLTTASLVTSGGIELEDEISNPMSLKFSANGKRIWALDHSSHTITQISLNAAYDTSTFTIDGTLNLHTLTSSNLSQMRGVTFSTAGIRMYIAVDSSGGRGSEDIFEYNLACPFNIFAEKCPSITDNGDRTAMAIAQIEIAKRTIDQSTDTVLNRLKWIRRNKDKQNLTNLNIDINFTNQMLASLTKAIKTSAAKKKKNDKEQGVFYWSEGSIAVGRIGDTSIASTRKIGTNAITVGSDKFTNNNGIKGLAFRLGRNNVDVGTSGSNLDTDTYNLTYYATSPVKDDSKFIDTIIGFGKLKSDILTVVDGKNLTAERKGEQLYGTIRIKDEIKKDNLIIIPSGRFDLGHTILNGYKETGTGAIDVKKQHVRTKKLRAGIAIVEDLSNNKYTFKRHGKLEYVADIDRSSNFKYNYASDKSVSFNDTLHSGALHNLNGEIGIDIIMPNSFSVFLIYERNQALGVGHTDKIHIAFGYLPNKETNYSFSIDGGDNLKSNYIFVKNINDYLINFKLTNDLIRPEDYDEASVNLSRKF